MYRYALESFGTLSYRTRSISAKRIRELSQKTGADEGDLEAEYAAARKWMIELNKDTIPMSLARISFARSSGAGGANVNKTSTKATLNWPLESIVPYVPKILHSELRRSRYYVTSSDSLQMSAQTSRSQGENKAECYKKLHVLLKNLGKQVVPGETSEAKKQKIEKLRKKEEANRLLFKSKRTAKKQARSSGARDD